MRRESRGEKRSFSRHIRGARAIRLVGVFVEFVELLGNFGLATAISRLSEVKQS